MRLRDDNIIICDCGVELNPEITTPQDFITYNSETKIAFCSNCSASGEIIFPTVETSTLIVGEIDITAFPFNAVGDGINDDTSVILSAISSSKKLYFPDGTYLITSDININSNFIITGCNATLKSSGSAKIIIDNTVTDFAILNITLDGVAVYSGDRSNGIDVNITLEQVSIKDTDYYGVQISNIGTLNLAKCNFSNIGKHTGIDITYQGIGVRANYVKKLFAHDNYFTQCHGTGAIVIRHANYLHVYYNNFYKNDYRGIALSNDDDTDLKTIGIIESNIIKECGTYASHTTGVGCNGIYGNDGDFNSVDVIHNKISNVCENGIEGTFGIVEDNDVDGTGVDMVNHPTISASGINMFGKVYRRNRVKNSYLSPYYVHRVGTEVSDLTVEDNVAENCDTSDTGYGMYINGTAYTNVTINGNRIDKPLYMNTSAIFNNVNFKDNVVPGGDFYSGTYNVIARLLDRGQILKNRFTFSDASTLSDYTTTNVTIAKQTETFNGINTYYPLITNTTNTLGYIKLVDLAVKQNQQLAIDISFKGADLDTAYVYVSVAFKDADGIESSPRVVKTISFGAGLTDFVTKTILHKVPSGAVSVNIYFKLNNNGSTGATANASAYIKDIIVRCIPK